MNSRRRFIRNTSLLMTLPLVSAEITAYASRDDDPTGPYRTIASVYDDMFPETPNIPGAKRLNSIGYLHGVMNDERVDKDTKVFITNGAIWLDEESEEMFKGAYHQLTPLQRQQVLDAVLEYRWGDSWLYTIMSYLFESMFCDPIYGANSDMSGWRWLAYEPGLPRPTKVAYERI